MAPHRTSPLIAPALARRLAPLTAVLWLGLFGLLAPLHEVRHRAAQADQGRATVSLLAADADCALCALAAQPAAPAPPPAAPPAPAATSPFVSEAPCVAVPAIAGAALPSRTGRAPPDVA